MDKKDTYQGFLKHKLQSFESEPPVDLWDAIAAEVPGKKEVKPLWLKYAPYAVAASITLLLLIFWPKPKVSVKNEGTIAETPVQVPIKEEPQELPPSSLQTNEREEESKEKPNNPFVPQIKRVRVIEPKDFPKQEIVEEKANRQLLAAEENVKRDSLVPQANPAQELIAEAALEKIQVPVDEQTEIPLEGLQEPIVTPEQVAQPVGQAPKRRKRLNEIGLDDVVLFTANKISQYKEREDAVQSFEKEDDENNVKQYRIRLGGLTFTRKVHRKRQKT